MDAGKHLPLANRRVIVTRAVQQASALSEKLTQLGAEVIEIPTIQIAAATNSEDLSHALEQLETYDWIVFASANAVTYFMQQCQREEKTILQGKKIAAIGPSTSAALAEFDLQADFQPQQAVGESFLEEFPKYANLDGTKILWPRTNIGRQLIAQSLIAAGAQLDIVHCYRTTLPDDADTAAVKLRQHLFRGSILTVASSQSVRNLALLLQRGFSCEEAAISQMTEILSGTAVISIGPQTTATAWQCLGKCDGQAQRFDVDGLVDAVCAYVESNG